jgi:hypothetical protein
MEQGNEAQQHPGEPRSVCVENDLFLQGCKDTCNRYAMADIYAGNIGTVYVWEMGQT